MQIEERLKHLEFIQNVITRMNTNSFQIKAMTIAIVSGCIAIYVSSSKLAILYLSILPTLFFWFLDAFYLFQERKYRVLYDKVVEDKEYREVKLFNMSTKDLKTKETIIKTFFSITIAFLYASIIAIILLACILLRCI